MLAALRATVTCLVAVRLAVLFGLLKHAAQLLDVRLQLRGLRVQVGQLAGELVVRVVQLLQSDTNGVEMMEWMP